RACPGLSSSWLKAEMLSQIDLPDVFIINNFVRRSRGQHTAFVDDVGPVADAQRLAHVVIGDHHADFAFLQEADDLLYVEHRDRIDAGERLVEQMKRGLVASARA